jgi:hypothetical protein
MKTCNECDWCDYIFLDYYSADDHRMCNYCGHDSFGEKYKFISVHVFLDEIPTPDWCPKEAKSES